MCLDLGTSMIRQALEVNAKYYREYSIGSQAGLKLSYPFPFPWRHVCNAIVWILRSRGQTMWLQLQKL